MAYFFTEQQVVDMAIKAYREHSARDAQLRAEWETQATVSLVDWIDPDTEVDQLGEAFKDGLASLCGT